MLTWLYSVTCADLRCSFPFSFSLVASGLALNADRFCWLISSPKLPSGSCFTPLPLPLRLISDPQPSVQALVPIGVARFAPLLGLSPGWRSQLGAAERIHHPGRLHHRAHIVYAQDGGTGGDRLAADRCRAP